MPRLNRFQRDNEHSDFINRVRQKSTSLPRRHTLHVKIYSRSSQNVHLSSLNRYSRLLKKRERCAPFTLNSELGQIDEERNTLKKKLMNMSKTFKVKAHAKVDPDSKDIKLPRKRSVSRRIEEEKNYSPLNEVSDSLSN